MSKILTRLEPVAKALVAAVLPLVTVSLANGSFDWKAILASALTAIAVYFVPNKITASAS